METYFLTSLPDITFETESTGIEALQDSVRVEISIVYNGYDKHPVFDEILYPDSSGRLTLTDLETLLRPYSEKSKIMEVQIQFTSFTGKYEFQEFRVIYLSGVKIQQAAADYLNTHFLTLSTQIRTAHGRTETLYFYAADAWTEYFNTDNTPPDTARVEVLATFDTFQMQGMVLEADLVDSSAAIYKIDVSPDLFTRSDATLVYYEVRTLDQFDPDSGEPLRGMTFITSIRDENPPTPIEFCNAFGITETLHAAGTRQTKQTLQRSTAYIDGRITTYMAEETLQLTIDSGRIPDCMLPSWNDLVRARQIDIVDTNETRQPHILTAEKAETNSDPDHMTRFTITLRPAERTQHMITDNRPTRVFDNTFNDTFE